MYCYAIIPVEKIDLYISVNTQYGRFSNDEKYLVWDQNWSSEIFEKMQVDSEVLTMDEKQVILEMQKENWKAAHIEE